MSDSCKHAVYEYIDVCCGWAGGGPAGSGQVSQRVPECGQWRGGCGHHRWPCTRGPERRPAGNVTWPLLHAVGYNVAQNMPSRPMFPSLVMVNSKKRVVPFQEWQSKLTPQLNPSYFLHYCEKISVFKPFLVLQVCLFHSITFPALLNAISKVSPSASCKLREV